MQNRVDRNGIDVTSGTIASGSYESVDIGNKYSGLSMFYSSSGIPTLTGYLQFEKLLLYSGGILAVRVNGGGEVHTFNIGSLSMYTYGGNMHPAWTFGPIGTATSTSQTDVFTDVNDDGALLACSGPATRMYKGGTCSLYLANSGLKIDYRIPSVNFDFDILAQWATNTGATVGYAWPTKMTKADGEVVTYNYNDYDEHSYESTTWPPAPVWNSTDSSLGFRIYSELSQTGIKRPGADYPDSFIGSGGRLYAINLSHEYASPSVTTRTFGPSSLSSVFTEVAGSSGKSFDLYTNGVKILNRNTLSGYLTLVKPLGGQISYPGGGLPSLTFHSNTGGASTPSNAFPYGSFSAVKNGTTQYSVTWDQSYPEKYTENVINPDGSSETYVVRYGNIYSYKDGLDRVTTYEHLNAEGYYAGIPGYSTISKPSAINYPDGRRISLGYTRGALTSVVTYPSDGSGPLSATFTLLASCSTANYRVCNKPQYMIDANGNRTDYTYDPAHGGLLTETFPADASGVRPQKRYLYSQLYPKVLNSSGTLVNSPPVWRLTQISECMSATSANPASCVGTAAERRTSYAYNDNNLFLTSVTIAAGDGSTSSTTSYGYNYAGDVTVVDGPRTDVDDRTYTTYDVLRRKVFEIGADPDGSGGTLPRQITRHVYDADGNEIRTELGAGSAVDGSDFAMHHFVRRTFDSVTGLKIKEEIVEP